MTTRAELEDEWREYQLWRDQVSVEFTDYLDHRELIIARENMATLKEFMDGLPGDYQLTISELRELLSNA